MIATTFAGQTVWLLQEEPNWASRVQSTHGLVTEATAGLSNRESRRPYAGALRSTLSFSVLLSGDVLRALQGAARQVQAHPILCPFWPAQTTWAARSGAPIQGGLKLAWKEDWSQWELYSGAEPSWPAASDSWAPVLWGSLGDRSAEWFGSTWYHAALASISVLIGEDGPAAYALQPAAAGAAAGPMPPSGYATAPRLLPVAPNVANEPRQTIRLRIDRQGTGFRRQRAAEFYPQSVARGEQLDFLLGMGDVASLLAFFRDHAGRGEAFWWPSEMSAAQLSAAVAAAATVLPVTDTELLQVGDYIALRGATLICRRVTALSAGSVTLNAAVGADLPAHTLVTPLLLARLDQPRITLDWTHSDLAETGLSVREVPTEYVPGADETVGTTLGALPERCYLYDFVRDHGGVVLHDRFTSYESDVTYGGHTWVSADVSHGGIEHGLSLDVGAIDLNSRVFTGNPLVALAIMRTEVPLKLNVLMADVTAGVASNVQILASGEVDKAALRGERITGRLTPGGRLMSQQAPRFEVGPGCNHSLFAPGCGLSRSAWRHTALVNGALSPAYPFAVSLDGLARTTGPTPTYFADWFAHGVIEVGTPGDATWQSRWILKSTAPASGALDLQLHRALDPLPADNAPVVLYPGCDLTEASCRAYHATTNPLGKFDNFANFGGHPDVPAGNPSLFKMSTNLGGGKK